MEGEINFDEYHFDRLYIACKAIGEKINKNTKRKEMEKILKKFINVDIYLNNLDYIKNLSAEEDMALYNNINIKPVPINVYLIDKTVNFNKYYQNNKIKKVTESFRESKSRNKFYKEIDKIKEEVLEQRENRIKKVKKEIIIMKKIIDNAPDNKEDLILFRGMKTSYAWGEENKNLELFTKKFLSLKEKSIFSFDSFPFFSLNPMHSIGFTKKDSCCFLKLTIKANTLPVLFTGNIKELEIIFKPETKFLVDKVSYITSEVNEMIKIKFYEISVADLK